jgi:hypothetical protein
MAGSIARPGEKARLRAFSLFTKLGSGRRSPNGAMQKQTTEHVIPERSLLSAPLHNALAAAYNLHDGCRMSIMLKPILRMALPALVAGAAGLQLAHADIYTWADASGSVNVSNLAPPQGARVISVTRTSPADAARENAARDAARRAETLALEERVRQLEADAELAKRQPPPQVVYPVIPAPPSLQYGYDPAPPPVQYTVYSSAPAYTMGCDPGWMACALGWLPNFYSTGIVFVRAPSSRRSPSFPVRHPPGPRQAPHSFGHSARG